VFIKCPGVHRPRPPFIYTIFPEVVLLFVEVSGESELSSGHIEFMAD
jgi:hypothetical protein